MKMKELSARTGISDRTIRYYIDDGLFIPENYTENYEGRRSYEFTENDVKRLKQIALLRKYGFSINEIKELGKGNSDLVKLIEKRLSEAKESSESQLDEIKALEAVAAKQPKDVDELCEMLSNPIVENEPIPSIDEQSAYKPMYKKSKKRNMVYVILITFISTIAILIGLFFGWYYLMTGLPVKADINFEATQIYVEPLANLKDNVQYDSFFDILSENYRLGKNKIKDVYNNADDYVVVTVYGNLENYHEYNVFKFRPKNVRIIGADDESFLVSGQKSRKTSELYYNYLLSGRTWENFPIDLLMTRQTYDKLNDEGRLNPENVSAEIECEVFFDPIYENNSDTPSVEIVNETSFFSDYELKNDKVYIYCTVTVKNNLDTAQQIMIQGDFADDYLSGFVKDKILCAYDKDNLDNNMFIIMANSEQMLKVCFIGDWGGKVKTKQNRLLPEIQL